jgi:hypothetical protein
MFTECSMNPPNQHVEALGAPLGIELRSGSAPKVVEVDVEVEVLPARSCGIISRNMKT